MVCLVAVLLFCVWGFVPSHCFNIDTEQPEIFIEGEESRFGQRVLQFGNDRQSWVIVSAPEGGNGSLYRCNPADHFCEPIYPYGGPENTSLSTLESSASRLVACGSNVPQTCISNMHLNGICYIFNENLEQFESLKPMHEECTVVQVDVVFLFDGSNSLTKRDLENNKRFMLEMMMDSDHEVMQFAVVQYSGRQRLEMSFHTFRDKSTDLKTVMDSIELMESVTLTATAINYVIKKVFTKEAGARDGATRLLIVITDGEATTGDLDINKTIELAKEKGIVRCAIGVGKDFEAGSKGEQMLKTIASSPSYLIKVKRYEDLQSIFEGLKTKIYNIEGAHDYSNESSFEFEMSQGGFSAIVTPEAITLGAVGAFDWSGGLMEFRGNETSFINVSKAHSDMKDAYLGYSVESAARGNQRLYVVGAPRYRHRGTVIVFQPGHDGSPWEPRQHIPGEQIGSYFGCELCTVDLTGDGETDLLLIGAPLYHDQGIGGTVIVCTMSPEGNFSCTGTLRGVEGNELGRFGSAIAALTDLNGDGLGDVAIGAPLEDEHRGSVYIYHGKPQGIGPRYSQRIEAFTISRGLRYFGQSVDGTMDVTGDGLMDIAVGALGKAVLLRSRPVLNVTWKVSFSPKEIPLQNFCTEGPFNGKRLVSNLSICFDVTPVTRANQGTPLSILTYHLELDPSRPMGRAVFESTERPFTRNLTVTEGTNCVEHQIHLLACVEDYLAPIELTIDFSLMPTALKKAQGLLPVLNSQCNRTLLALLPMEKDCGEDGHCTDHLSVNFHLGGMGRVLVGNSSVLDISLSLENLGEDSYKTTMVLSHPPGFTFKKFNNEQATQVDCASSLNSTGIQVENFSCNVSHPIFRSNQTANFVLTFEVSDQSTWEESVPLKVIANSDNELRILDNNFHTESIPVLYTVKVIITSVRSTRYVRLMENEEEAQTVRHTYKVENLGGRGLPVNVTFRVETGRRARWEIQDRVQSEPADGSECVALDGPGEVAESEDWTKPGAMIASKTISCRVRLLEANGSVLFTISGAARSMSSLEGDGDLGMTSRANVTLDQRRYVDIYYPRSHQAQATTQIEFQKYFSAKWIIIGSIVGGLVLLILIVFGLYKCGFFNRRFKGKQCDSEGEASNPMNTATDELATPTDQVTAPTDQVTAPTDQVTAPADQVTAPADQE
ncbi:integrin alpha-X-like isoform X2 [Heptranchias perlo]|uniref:integrin alpha-X-like isoform X2 n=1 Tax=Heptranchias perlo TaxID=212740 RepID=UPI00355A2D02